MNKVVWVQRNEEVGENSTSLSYHNERNAILWALLAAEKRKKLRRLADICMPTFQEGWHEQKRVPKA